MTENLPTKYQPKEVEAGRYQKWLEQDLLKPTEARSKTLFNCYSTTKCNREVALRSCLGYNVTRYDHSSKTDARL